MINAKSVDLCLIQKYEGFLSALRIDGCNVSFEPLGQGEYNINYLFCHPQTGEKLVLRVTTASQMSLQNQIRYEYDALRLLEGTGRTPAPLYIDDTKDVIPYGFLVMRFLPGRHLVYENESDMDEAAHCLAEIHGLAVSGCANLIKPENPLRAILDECHNMAEIYFGSHKSPSDTKALIKELLNYGEGIIETGVDCGSRSIINTELNSGNFLINGSGKCFLVDWEKPLYAYPAQDLGHFLAPTTTYWKTDTILTKDEILSFINKYTNYSDTHNNAEELWNSVRPYLAMNCLRGITWCAMAQVEYQSTERLIKNEFTYKKIQKYLETAFLNKIRKEYLGC